MISIKADNRLQNKLQVTTNRHVQRMLKLARGSKSNSGTLQEMTQALEVSDAVMPGGDTRCYV